MKLKKFALLLGSIAIPLLFVGYNVPLFSGLVRFMLFGPLAGAATSILLWFVTIPMLVISAFGIRYVGINYTRTAKTKLDNHIFFGTVLVYVLWCYFLGFGLLHANFGH
jgi:hypothetical protein